MSAVALTVIVAQLGRGWHHLAPAIGGEIEQCGENHRANQVAYRRRPGERLIPIRDHDAQQKQPGRDRARPNYEVFHGGGIQ